MSHRLEKLHPPIYMDEFISSLRSFLHQGCPCLSLPSITAAFAEIVIKISAPRFALFLRWGIWMKGRFFKEMALCWLTVQHGCQPLVVCSDLFLVSLFWNVSFACPTYCIPQSELEAFFSLIQISRSVCSLLAPPLSLFPSGFSAICSCLWHLLSSPFHYSFWLCISLLCFLFFTFPFPFHPVWITPLTDCVALFLDIFGSSGTAQQPWLSVYLGRNSSPLYT